MKSIRNIACPNVSAAEWKSAVAQRGEDMAWREWVASQHPGLWDDSVVQDPVLDALNQIIPRSTVIQKLSRLANANPNAASAYLNSVIYLGENYTADQAYHEAFHSILQDALSEEEIEQALAEAETELRTKLRAEGKTLRRHIQDKRDMGYFGGNDRQARGYLSDEEALPKVYEEYLADRFAAWKLEQDNKGWLAHIFQRIQDFISNLFSQEPYLKALFKSINSGYYSGIAQPTNRFSDKDNLNPDYKLLRKSDELYFSAEWTNNHVAQLVSAYASVSDLPVAKRERWDDLQILDFIVARYAQRYSDWQELGTKDAKDMYMLHTEPSRKAELLDAMKNYLRSFKSMTGLRNELEDLKTDLGERVFINAESAPQGGLDTIPTFVRMYIASTGMKQTTRTAQEEQELLLSTEEELNPETGYYEPIPVYMQKPVNVNKIYGSMLRAMANTLDPKLMFARMVEYSNPTQYIDAAGMVVTVGNPDTQIFIKRFIEDVQLELDPNEAGYMTPKQGEGYAKRMLLYQRVKLGFNRWAKNTIFQGIDPEKGIVQSHYANRQGVDQMQMQDWSIQYNDLQEDPAWNPTAIKQLLDQASGAFTEASGYYRDDSPVDVDEPMSAKEKLARDIGYVVAATKPLGISLHPSYIKYALLRIRADKFDRQYGDQDTPEDFMGEGTITQADYTFVRSIPLNADQLLTAEDFEQFGLRIAGNSQKEKNLYHRESILTGEELMVDEGVTGRLLKIARGNAAFDEDIFESSWTAADGTIRYLHQDGTYNLKIAAQLRNADFINQLVTTGIRDKNIIIGYDQNGEAVELDYEGSAQLKKNRLLQAGSDFRSVHGAFAIEELDGIRQRHMADTDTDVRVISDEFKKDQEGAHYGDMNDREFSVMLLNLYGGSMRKVQQVNRNGKPVSIVLVPQLITIMESSKSSDVAWLPVITGLYKEGALTASARGLLRAEVMKEAERIQRVAQEILLPNGKVKDPSTINAELGYVIEDYHTGKSPRALLISDKVASLLTTEVKEELEAAAKAGKLADFDLAKLEDTIASQYQGLLDSQWQRLQDSGEVTVDVEGNTKAPFLTKSYTEGDVRLGFEKDALKDNVFQAITQAFLNGISITEIMYGDQAATFKNDPEGADPFKRNKTANAKGASVAHNAFIEELGVTPFQYSNIAIIEDPRIFSKIPRSDGKGGVTFTSLDEADAQMWCSMKAIRNTLFGLGRLTPDVAQLLDKIDKGEYVSAEDLYEKSGHILSQDKMLNSFKLVFRDASRVLKMSVVPLSKALTSTNVGTAEKPDWRPIPGWEVLDSLRQEMEAKDIDFVTPKSASKTTTINMLRRAEDGSIDFSKLQASKFNNEYMMLQLENPSNKTKITSPTQLLHAIDIEQQLSYIDENGDEQLTTVVLPSGKEISIKSLRDGYQKAMADKSSVLYNSARNEFYDAGTFTEDINHYISTGQVKPRLGAFQQRALQTLATTGADSQLLEFFETDMLDGKPVPKYDLNSDLTVNKYIDLYWSHFSNGGFSMKSPGYSAALFSHYGSSLVKEITGIHDGVLEWRVVRRDSAKMKAHIKSGKQAPQMVWKKPTTDGEFQYIPEGNWKVGDVFMDKLAYNKPVFKDGKLVSYISEMIMPHQTGQQFNVDEDLMNRSQNPEISEAIRYNFGNRIPLQDKQSMMALEWVDTLPAFYGSTAIFPPEIIELSGADFDIDKEYITAPDVYQDANGNFKKYGSGTTFKERFEEYRMWHLANNRYLRMLVQQNRENEPRYQELKQLVETLNLEKKEEIKAVKGIQRAVASLLNELSQKNNDQLIDDEDYNPNADKLALKNDLLEVGAEYSASIKSLSEQVKDYLEELDNLTNGFFAKAMREMQLPDDVSSFEQYAAHTDPSPGSANNKILDGFLGMLTNDGVRRGVADEPATEDYLKDLSKRSLTNIFTYTAEDGTLRNVFDNKAKTPTDFFGTHINAKKKIQIGKNNVGIVVSQMVHMSIMKKAGVNLTSSKWYINIGGRMYSDITVYKEWEKYDKGVPTGMRLMNVVSTLISAATDEAKNGNNARFNINEGALKAMGSMILYGVPLEHQIALINQPVIQSWERMNTVKRSSITTQDEQRSVKYDEDQLSEVFATIVKDLPSNTFGGVLLGYGQGKDDSFESLGRSLAKHLTPTNMANVLIWEKQGKTLTDEEQMLKAAVQIASLELYMRMDKLTEYKSKLGKILALNKKINGFKTVDDALDAAQSMGLLDGVIDTGFPFDIRYAMTGNVKYKDTIYKPQGKKGPEVRASNGNYIHHITIQYLKQLKEVNELAKLNFLHRTKPFRNMWNGTLTILKQKRDGTSALRKDKLAQLEKDMRSFVQIAAYKQYAVVMGDLRDTLSKGLIYDIAGDKNIIAIMKKLRQAAPGSPLVKYLTPYDKKYKRGSKTFTEIHTVEANTRAKLSDTQMANLMNAFEELWIRPDTHDLAGALIDYLLVKDSFQFKNRSVSKVIPVSAMGTILKAGQLAQNLMRVEIPRVVSEDKSNIKPLQVALANLRDIVSKEGVRLFTKQEWEEGGLALYKAGKYEEALDWGYKKLMGYTRQGLYNQFAKLVATDVNYQFDIPVKSFNETTFTPEEGISFDKQTFELTVDLSSVKADPTKYYKTGVNEKSEDILELLTTPQLKAKLLERFGVETRTHRKEDPATKRMYFSVPKYIRSGSGDIYELVGRTYEGKEYYDPNGLQLPVGASEFFADRFTYRWLPTRGTSNSRPMADLTPYAAEIVTSPPQTIPINEESDPLLDKLSPPMPQSGDDTYYTDAEVVDSTPLALGEGSPLPPTIEPVGVASTTPAAAKKNYVKAKPTTRQPQNLHEAILQYFSTGGKIQLSDFARYGDPKYMKGAKGGNPYLAYIVGDSKASSVDTIARSLVEDSLGRSMDQFDEKDVIQQIIDTIVSFSQLSPTLQLQQYQAKEKAEEVAPETNEPTVDPVVTEEVVPTRRKRRSFDMTGYQEQNTSDEEIPGLDYGTNANPFTPPANAGVKRCN